MRSRALPRLSDFFLFVLLVCVASAARDVQLVQPLPLSGEPRRVSQHIDELFRGQRIRPPGLGSSSRSAGTAEYELADLVLVTTVADGAVHALRRATGQRIWTLHDTDAERAESILGPLVRSSATVSAEPVRSGNASSHLPVEPRDLPEESYIVEPGTGAIFLHLRSSGKMQRLPLSVADLVDSSPFTFADDSSRMFVGKKATQLVGVDLASGRVVGLFGPEAGWCEWKMQPGMTGASSECEDAIDQRPQDLLYMGRTEYQLSVFEKSRGELIQSLAYTMYHPSTLASPGPPWNASPDDRYIQSLHNGELVCLRTTRMGWEWHSQELQSPVAEIFDVVVTNTDEKSQPVLFNHPIPQPPEALSQSYDLPDLTYVGQTGENTFFAMSRRRFPFIGINSPVFGAPLASESRDGLLGLHQVEGSTYETGSRRSPLAIDAPNDQPLELPAGQDRTPPLLESGPARLTLPPSAETFNNSIWPLVVSILACAVAAVFWSRWRYSRSFVTHTQSKSGVVASSEASEDSHEAVTPPSEDAPIPRLGATYDKALPPLPGPLTLSATQSQKELDVSDEDTSDEDGKNGAPKRKKRRGKRGKSKAQQRIISAALATGSSVDALHSAIPSDPVLEVAAKEGEVRVGSLIVSDQVLGIGSHGTIVLRGEFQGRAVAVKRMLKQLITVATHEVALLQETDEHANVIRYFCKEQRDNFLYIALELCPRSLADLIERPASCEPELVAALNAKQALRQITSGLTHLHGLKIVHRDIKPPNILVAQRRAPDGSLRMLISDFGLCKRLDGDASSFHQSTTYDAAGSVGWRAPEVLRGDVDPNEDGSSSGLAVSESSSNLSVEAPPRKRLTRAIDIFSLGCLAYYLLSHGEHPFGGRYERESNILKANYVLDKLDGLGDEAVEAQAMIESMIAGNANDRPSAGVLQQHPFFWTASQRLHFICDASDRFETMEREPPDPVLIEVEREAMAVVGADWLKALDRALIENLGKYRKYDGGSVRDLLRVIRNKKNHFQDLPDNVKRSLGAPPEGFLGYFTHRFPRLFLHVWTVVRQELSRDQLFETYFSSTYV